LTTVYSSNELRSPSPAAPNRRARPDKPAIENGQPVRDRFLVFGNPLIEEDAIAEVVDSLRSGWLGTGPKVHAFEKMFRAYLGVEHCAAVGSCTAALHLSMLALGIGPGDEVIVPAMTFCATANAVFHAGATPVFADVCPETANVDPACIAAAVTERTKAVIVVHFAGRPCPMDAICDITRRHGLHLIEDCAHAVETEFKGRKAGSFGDVSAFSFYVTKNITTGEGGMVATNREDLFARIKVLALHGLSNDAWSRFSDAGYKHYEVTTAGFKYNMTDIQAALALHQLPKIDLYARRRSEIWQAYQTAFADLRLLRPAPPEADTRHARHLYTILADLERLSVGRDHLLNALQAEGIGTGVHYLALSLYPFYQNKLGCRAGDYPNAEYISERTISLPLSAKLSDADVEDVIAAVRKVFRYYEK